ncbi:MAG TPA: hypothetical protein VGF25_12720 [Thermoleophilaceae bacterium]|jgi:hypothetical protein
MDGLVDDLTRAYDRNIQVPGKETHFLVLLAFLLSFGFIRTSAHMIRAQVSWWPGNVETKSGTHIHHLVWGILLLLVMGYVGIAIAPGSPWIELVAILFGIGMGLTLDEFALWLNLEDVYWSSKGRQSIDAVVVAACLLVLSLLGLQFWIDVYEAGFVFLGYGGHSLSGSESAALLVPWQLLGAGLGLICFLKGKLLTGVIGLFIPAVALVGAIRLAKPESPWARRYEGTKAERARTRFAAA